MIKLTDIVQEIVEKPEKSKLYNPPANTPGGTVPKPTVIYDPEEEKRKKDKEEEEKIMQTGFKSKQIDKDEQTGKVTYSVEYVPEFMKIRKQLHKYVEEFKPFKFSQHKDISDLGKLITKTMNQVSNMIYAIDKTIELYKKDPNN